MNQVVPIKSKYYRLIVRVVMNGRSYHHCALAENQETRIAFSKEEIEKAFEIRNATAWAYAALTSLVDAQRELDRKLRERGVGLCFEEKGFLVTIRPNNHEEPISTYPFHPL